MSIGRPGRDNQDQEAWGIPAGRTNRYHPYTKGNRYRLRDNAPNYIGSFHELTKHAFLTEESLL